MAAVVWLEGRGLGHCAYSTVSLDRLSADGRVGVIRVDQDDTEGGTSGYSLVLVRLEESGHAPFNQTKRAAPARGPVHVLTPASPRGDEILPYHGSTGAGGAPHTPAELAAAKRKEQAFYRSVAQHKVQALDAQRTLQPDKTRKLFLAGVMRVEARYDCGARPATRLSSGKSSVALVARQKGGLAVVKAIYRTDSPRTFVVETEDWTLLPKDACPPSRNRGVCGQPPAAFRRVTFPDAAGAPSDR